MSSALSFVVARREADAPSSFELGDLTVVGPNGNATSIGKTPDQGMMIYIALSELMSGVAKLVRDPRSGYRFVGTDSSFVLWFERRRARGLVAVRQGQQVLAEQTAEAIARRLLAEVDRFWGEHPLGMDDSVRQDFLSSRDALRRALG